MISIIIPVLNEEDNIDKIIDNLSEIKEYDRDIVFEVIFSDGGSSDNTKSKIMSRAYEKSIRDDFYIRVIDSKKGRGQQLNAGIKLSKYDVLFFLHADSKVEPDVLSKIYNACKDNKDYGCLKLKMDSNKLIYRFGEIVSNRRSEKGICFGDQGIYMTKEHINKYGSFPNIALMEDYEYSKKMMSFGILPNIIDSYITTSVRRFEEKGPIRMGIKMYLYRYQYDRGKSVDKINEKY